MRSSATFESAMSSSSIGACPDHCDSRCPNTSGSSARATTYLNCAAWSARPLASWFGGARRDFAEPTDSVTVVLLALRGRTPLPLAGRGQGSEPPATPPSPAPPPPPAPRPPPPPRGGGGGGGGGVVERSDNGVH